MHDDFEHLRTQLMNLGFDVVRFTDCTELKAEYLVPWLEEGCHADMDWMEKTAEKRLAPERVLPGVSSLILLGVNYYSDALVVEDTKPKIARYAQYNDYHDTIKPALVQAGKVLEEVLHLKPNEYRYYVDTGPILERHWAARAGLGFVGKNAMLISRQFGNYLLLSAILIKAQLPKDSPVKKIVHEDDYGRVGLLCGKCTACIDVCPTQALVGPGKLDARKCISYHTIENKGIIPVIYRKAIGNRIFGCDACLEVCPWNRYAKEAKKILLHGRAEGAGLTLKALLSLTKDDFKRLYKKTPIERLKYRGLLRNVCIAAGNSNDESLVDYLTPLLTHEAVIVRAHAVWAIKQLLKTKGAAYLAPYASSEVDPDVLAEYSAV